MSRKELHIDWLKFNGYTFQDMCNDLLVAENINIVPFKSGPYADKGQDARLFEGSIGDISGRIIFQCKYHEPKPGKTNLNSLKKDIKGTSEKKGELDKADDAKADHLITLTNVTVIGPKQHDELLKLAEGRLVKLHIWDEAKIKALLVKHPYVRFFHIKGPDYPMFVTHDHFFEKFLRDRPKDILTHLTNLSGREDELQACQEFLSSDANLLAIYAAPGQGKSRLVLEFSRFAEKETGWKPMFVRPEGKVLKDHLEELNPHLKYLLFIEDAHQFHHRLGEFLELLQGGRDVPQVKLVLTARTSLSGIVNETFSRLQPFETATIRMSELPQEEILKILKDQLPNLSDIYLRDLLPIVKDSPLLTVAAARLIKMGKPLAEILKPGQLRNLLFEIPLEDLAKYCIQKCEDPERYKRILTVIAAIQPVPMNDGELISKISEYLTMEEHDFRSAVDRLSQFGFLKHIGRMIRLTPESVSDIILEKYCLTSEGDSTGLGEQLAEYFFNYSLEELLNNFCDVGEMTFREKKPDILKKVFDTIKQEARSANNFARSDTIEKLQRVGARRADDVLEIIEIMMCNPSKDTAGYTTHAQLLGTISNLLDIVARNPYYIKDALQVLK